MNILAKLIQKYGSPKDSEVILPPPSDGTVTVELPKEEPLPEIADPDLEQMEKDWFIFDRDQHLVERDRIPNMVDREIEKMKRDRAMEDEDVPMKTYFRQELPPTVVHKKKASYDPDHIMRLCNQYHDLCCKL